jgi:hypothetical protein
VVATPLPPVFEIWGTPGACLHVAYNGEASHAEIETSRRGFSQSGTSNVLRHTVATGSTITRCFSEACIEADAEQVGVKPIGGIWFDVNQNPFTNPERFPEKIAACSRGIPTPSPTPSPSPSPSPSPTPCPKKSFGYGGKKCK